MKFPLVPASDRLEDTLAHPVAPIHPNAISDSFLPPPSFLDASSSSSAAAATLDPIEPLDHKLVPRRAISDAQRAAWRSDLDLASCADKWPSSALLVDDCITIGISKRHDNILDWCERTAIDIPNEKPALRNCVAGVLRLSLSVCVCARLCISLCLCVSVYVMNAVTHTQALAR
jgi:hypothetical protein